MPTAWERYRVAWVALGVGLALVTALVLGLFLKDLVMLRLESQEGERMMERAAEEMFGPVDSEPFEFEQRFQIDDPAEARRLGEEMAEKAKQEGLTATWSVEGGELIVVWKKLPTDP